VIAGEVAAQRAGRPNAVLIDCFGNLANAPDYLWDIQIFLSKT
jgi:hypothetical protein